MSIRAAKANLDVAADVLSANRNIINGATHGLSVALPFLTALQGVLAFFAGAYTAASSFWETRQAVVKKDEQGKVLGAFGILAGFAQMALGSAAATCGSELMAHHPSFAAAAAAGDDIAPALMAVNGLFLLRSCVMIRHAQTFEQGLLGDDEELKNFLVTQYCHNHTHVARMLGKECHDEIKKLEEEEGQFVDMKALRQKITRECLKAKITHVAVSILCILGIIATFAGLLLEDICPILSCILYAIGATLWIFVDRIPLHLKVRDLIVNRTLGPLLPTEAPAQKIAPPELLPKRVSACERLTKWVSLSIRSMLALA